VLSKANKSKRFHAHDGIKVHEKHDNVLESRTCWQRSSLQLALLGPQTSAGSAIALFCMGLDQTNDFVCNAYAAVPFEVPSFS